MPGLICFYPSGEALSRWHVDLHIEPASGAWFIKNQDYQDVTHFTLPLLSPFTESTIPSSLLFPTLPNPPSLPLSSFPPLPNPPFLSLSFPLYPTHHPFLYPLSPLYLIHHPFLSPLSPLYLIHHPFLSPFPPFT